MNKTKIEWCDSTWNPVTGCCHNCEYCYARRIACRFGKTDSSIIDGIDVKPVYNNGAMLLELNKYVGNPYPWLFTPTFHKYKLDEMKNKKGQNVFVCSMADLFGDWVPAEWIDQILEACENAPQHNYIFLTKRPEGYYRLVPLWKVYHNKGIYKNIWFGTSITNLSSIERIFQIRELAEYQGLNTFLSIEPLLSPIGNEPFREAIKGIKWVIIGAETGNRRDKVIPRKQWIDEIVMDCVKLNIPVFMKDSLVPIVGEENMLREFPEGLRKEKV